LLAEHFLEKYTLEHGKHIKRISTPAIDMLTSYHWPGNVRELENTMARAVLVCSDNVIHGYHLPPTLQTAEASGTVVRTSLMDAIAAYEKELIQDALKTTRGNRARAAKLLDNRQISPQRLLPQRTCQVSCMFLIPFFLLACKN
jgi:Nif-specific regulatory protein